MFGNRNSGGGVVSGGSFSGPDDIGPGKKEANIEVSCLSLTRICCWVSLLFPAIFSGCVKVSSLIFKLPFTCLSVTPVI
jgi:hypothetical protein